MSELDQESMFDLSGAEFNKNFIDESQPLFVPANPLHWKAHRYQLLVARLDKQLENNPAQFNSKNYFDALERYHDCLAKIKEVENAINGSSEVVGVGNDGAASEVGDRNASSVGVGVSADNPFAGQGANPV